MMVAAVAARLTGGEGRGGGAPLWAFSLVGSQPHGQLVMREAAGFEARLWL